MRKWLKIIMISIVIWTALTSLKYRLLRPDKTETELFLHIPKSFVLNFK
jgi:hypothetical protein